MLAMFLLIHKLSEAQISSLTESTITQLTPKRP